MSQQIVEKFHDVENVRDCHEMRLKLDGETFRWRQIWNLHFDLSGFGIEPTGVLFSLQLSGSEEASTFVYSKQTLDMIFKMM